MGSWVKRISGAALAGLLACTGASRTEGPPGVSTVDVSGGPVTYELDSLDQRPVSSMAMAGKPTVLVFITTYDPISQLQLGELQPLVTEMPNVNFALVALQDAASRELVEMYRDTMKVTCPVALADAAIIAGGGPFGDVHEVPTLVVLAPDGRIAWKHTGPVRTGELRARLSAAR